MINLFGFVDRFHNDINSKKKKIIKNESKDTILKKIFMNDNIFKTIGILNCNKTCYYNSDENCTHPTQKTTKHYETDNFFFNDDNDESK